MFIETGITAPTLAPSERVLLHAETFATPVSLSSTEDDQVELFRPGARARATELGQALLTVVILACEQAGAIQLSVQSRRIWLGLRQSSLLHVDPGKPALWPDYTLEGQVYTLAQALREDKRAPDVRSLLYELLQTTVPGSPWRYVAELVKTGLAARGLVNKIEEKHTMIFARARWHLPETTARLAAAWPAAPLRQLLDECREMRPDVWRLLQAEIEAAVKARTENGREAG
jgi:hypothetical protein